MRRFASVFLSKHSDCSDKHTLNIIPPLLSPTSDHRSSGSSTTTTTSSSLRTPEDIPTRSISSKKSWISWLSVKSRNNKLSQPQLHEIQDESSDDSDVQSLSSPDLDSPLPIPPPISPSPFHHLTGSLFPRSCNHPRSLSNPQTMLSTMLKSSLRNSPLPPPDGLSLHNSSTPLPSFDEPAISDSLQVSPFSHGLRRWISRPCFEDRFLVWLPVPDSDDVICQRITGSSLGVAELEFSDAIDVMAGYTGDYVESLLQSNLPQVVLVPHEEVPEPTPDPSSSAPPSVSPHARNTPYKATPSPLRMQYAPPTPSSPALSTSTTKLSVPQEPDALPLSSSPKRGVRFAEDDKEDNIPLGYVLRIKKKREEKAKFLKEQQERRAFLEEKAKIEQERSKRDMERAEWERERKAWEKEKRAMDEERKAKLYAEEVAAARFRRDHQRTGMALPSTSTSPPPIRELESSFKQDSRRYSRPLYDSQLPRRLASELSVQTTGNFVPSSRSPSSSRPPSIAGHSPTSGSQSSSVGHSRSTYSAHTSSMEDVRGLGTSKKGKRTSMASISSSRPGGSDRASSYPSIIPPVPFVPVYAMDMPLLPPAPPFMMHQYPRPRPRSRHSGSPESSSSSSPVQRTPGTHSSEYVHQTPSSSRKPVHHRHSSGDTKPSGSWSGSHDRKQQRPQPAHSHSQPASYSRGRQHSTRFPLQAQSHSPSPWTALPTNTQLHEQMLITSSNRRQSVVS